jgi:hypothetical protein
MKALRQVRAGMLCVILAAPLARADLKPTDLKATLSASPTSQATPIVNTITFDGKYSCSIDTTDAPELTGWASSKVAPVIKEWYPKIVDMLPSDGFEPPTHFTFVFTPSYKGVAATSGTKVVCSSTYFAAGAHQADLGALVHEMVHIVQQYHELIGPDAAAHRPPTWLVEGIADYIRWYKYEPTPRGAQIRHAALVKARFNGSYRISANFLNFVTNKYRQDLVVKLNAALRGGKYESGIWKLLTGKSVDELNDEWKAALNNN